MTWRGVIISLPVEIDMCIAARVAEELITAVRHNSVVIVDMSATTFCDSMGTRAILQACRRAADDGTQLRLAAITAPVQRIFSLLGIEPLLDLYPGLEAVQGEVPGGQPHPIPS